MLAMLPGRCPDTKTPRGSAAHIRGRSGAPALQSLVSTLRRSLPPVTATSDDTSTRPDGPAPSVDTTPFDAVLLVSFGGPEAPEEVMPFLERVTRGRGVPPERLAEVAEHYHHFGGRSPINDQNREFLTALRGHFDVRGIDLPLYWGNRNSEPFLTDTLATMRDDGVTRAAVFVTSAYSSYSGCRQYRENLADAVAEVDDAPQLDKLRHYFDHPGFVRANADALAEAWGRLPADMRDDAVVAFVTHSIPTAMEDTSGPDGGAYTAQHRAAADAIVADLRDRGVDVGETDLVFCSRSGPPHVPWLEPDVNDYLTAQHEKGTSAVVLAPIGFVSDHMEVVFDLDTEAAETAAELGLTLQRASTAGTHPAFVAAVADLLVERAAVERGQAPTRSAASPLGPSHDVCPAGCCRNLRQDRPALCGRD
jgi:ferrochelatase